jgi:RNA polymerase-binding transcription factor DksA
MKPADTHIVDQEERQVAGGWTRDGAVQDQIDDTVTDAVPAARATMLTGESKPFWRICGEDIREGRRCAIAGVRTCGACQSQLDRPPTAGFNQRGSKDSQLW